MITAAEIRRSFLDYFSRNKHQIVPSAPLVPKDDPTLLFTNAGMVQFKKVFLGQERPSYSRAVSSQKCLRVGGKHSDLENVGRTRRHHTFFEMLGNFSFGDYFKEKAIYLAWEYLTKELRLPRRKLFISVYKEDDEAEYLWKKIADLPVERIYRLGEKENFWSMGNTGPCGPCSEILYDQGEGMACGPNCEIGVCDCDRYLEIWNLVFMQYERDEDGQIHPLPRPSIDTGMGLERIAAVCQGVFSNFDTDLFWGLIQDISIKAGVHYGNDSEIDTALRVIADHSRAVSFMIADGILPANEGRGYVLRRLIRRAFRFGRSLGLYEPFLHGVCAKMAEEMGEAYPELLQSANFISKVVNREEENFSKTLDKGLNILEEELRSLDTKGTKTVPGEIVFNLYDTFGFPIDIVKDLAERRGYQVDAAGFEAYMRKQRERSKAAWTKTGGKNMTELFSSYIESGFQTDFVGYDSLEATSRIVDILDVERNPMQVAEEGTRSYIITAKTPFYGESGGQVGDQGYIKSSTGLAKVEDTMKPSPEMIVHWTEIVRGKLTRDEEVSLNVEEGLRVATARNHTCTHLLHAALRKVLGEHIKQSGSLVSADRLRFDFTHISPMSQEELQQVEDEVNKAILSDSPVNTEVVDFKTAEQKGAVGFFTDKYEDRVRIVEIPGFSKELCGGTHLSSTGKAGCFFIISESGVAAGVRRIEASTGWNSILHHRMQREILQDACSVLKTVPESLSNKIQELQEQLRKAVKDKESIESQLASSGGRDIFNNIEEIQGIKVLTSRIDLPESSGMKGLRKIMDDLRTKFQKGIIFLATENQGKAALLLFVSKDLHDKITAPELIKEVAKEVDGSGGGRPDLAQAGGNDPSGIDRSMQKLKEILSSL